MAAVSLEERVKALEAEVERIKTRLPEPAEKTAVPWWEEIRGTFKNDPVYDEAMRLGREWRESQPIPDPDDK